MKRICFIIAVCAVLFLAAAEANAQYSVTSGNKNAEIYTINDDRSTLPIFSRLSAAELFITLNVRRDGQKSFDLTLKNSADGWMIGDNLFSAPGASAGLAFDFTTGSAYTLPSELVTQIIRTLTSKDIRSFGKNNARNAGMPQDVRLVLLDAAKLRKEDLDKYFMIVDPKKGTLHSLDYIPAKPKALDNMSHNPNGIIVKDRPVITAAANGQSDLLNKLLATGNNINEVEPGTGDNALIKAIRTGDDNISWQLLNKGINPKHTNRYGQNALHVSCERGFFDVSQKLLIAGVDINKKDNGGNTPLMYAAASPNPYLVDMLIRRGAKINEVNNNKSSALSFAAYNGNTRSAETLISSGADPALKDISGNSALMEAVKGGNESIVRKLLNTKGVNVNAYDQSGNTPLHIALQMPNNRLAEILIDAGADVNAANQSGRTPLMLAMAGRNDTMTKKILTKNPNLYQTDGEGRTAYDFAGRDSTAAQRVIAQAMRESEENALKLFDFTAANNLSGIANLLVKGARVNISDPETGNTPIFSAVANNYKDITIFLIKNGADINWQNKRGNTPLMVAVSTGDIKLIDILINYGAKVNLQNSVGDTALIWAVKLNNLDFVRALLAANANPNLRNYEGVSPLSIATGEDMTEVERMLRSFGAF
ncbi:MAG: ankyrin repeat domain-containing protein [Deferribacteraceae bacterium]|jgi:ankyrin repeat protein|nr:ankyrin repeat domain-containing protein [Deferribacteraceae bacterium]